MEYRFKESSRKKSTKRNQERKEGQHPKIAVPEGNSREIRMAKILKTNFQNQKTCC